MTTQIAAAAGITVLAISGARNFEVATQSGASQVFDRHSASLVSAIVAAVRAKGLEFVGIFDAISSPENYSQDLEILRALGGENTHLACTHPPPTENVPSGVKTGMIFAVNDVVAPVFQDFVTPALESGLLKCLPAPKVVGKGLEFVNEALKMSKAGVSATKLVVEV
jgi:NADPH:quinone reductase-like Zn-dependent oxidoreductase